MNDHVLKGVGPGWLTGKVSDFAGLVFFPCLLAEVIRPIVRTHRRAGILAIATTAAAFSLIKSWPAAAELAEQLVRPLRGPTTIRTDPTDLASLVVLPVTWHVWHRPRRLQVQTRGLRQVVLVAAVFTSAATSPSDPPAFASAIVVHDGRAFTDELGERSRFHFESHDGSEWTRIEGDAPEEVRAKVADPPRRATDPTEPDVEYRVVPGRRVEARSGLEPWTSEFEIPEGRRRYMRHRRTPWFSTSLFGQQANDFPPSRGFETVATLRTPTGTVVLVSMGNEGVLRRDEQRRWHREPLASGRPTPLDGGVQGLRWWELLSPIPLMVLYGVVTAAAGSLLLPPRPLEGRRAVFAIAGAVAIALGLVVAVLWPPAILAVLLLPASALLLGSAVARLTLAMMLTPLAAATPWVLWSQGSIEEYDTATLLGAAILVVGTAIGGATMTLLARRALRAATLGNPSSLPSATL